MDLNALAISTISSDYIKKYLTDINHKFTVEEQITIIFNSELTLKQKLDIYKEYINIIDDKELAYGISLIISNIETILESLDGLVPCYILLHTDEWDTRAYRNIDRLREKLKSSTDCKLTVDICDIDESRLIANIYLNDSYEAISYNILDESRWLESGLEDKYVYIPNNIHIGDVVKINKDITECEYVVIGDSDVPDEMTSNCCYTIDATISVIPKEVIPKDDRTYKEIIESIIKNRIYYIGDSKYDDVLVKHEDHMHITFAEKVVI